MGAAIELEIIRDTQEGSNSMDRIVREVGKMVHPPIAGVLMS